MSATQQCRVSLSGVAQACLQNCLWESATRARGVHETLFGSGPKSTPALRVTLQYVQLLRWCYQLQPRPCGHSPAGSPY